MNDLWLLPLKQRQTSLVNLCALLLHKRLDLITKAAGGSSKAAKELGVSLIDTMIANALIEAAHAARTADEGIRAKAREFGASYRRDLQLDPRIEALAASVKGVAA